jgi:hypothetical protein
MWWLLVIRMLLGLVFLATGIAKVRTPAANAHAAELLSVPRALAKPIGYTLAPIEIICGLGLLVTATAAWVAAVALLLLATFTVLVLGNLVSGRRPSCGCFGIVSREPIGWLTVMRNLALIAVAALLFVQAVTRDVPCRLGCYTGAWRRPVALLGAGLAIESVFLVLLASLIVRLTLQAGRVQLRLGALEAGTHQRAAHTDVVLNGHSDRPAMPADVAAWLKQVGSGVLIFVAEGCAACDQLLSSLEEHDEYTILFVSTSSTYPMVHGHPVAIDRQMEFWQSMHVQFSPTAVLVNQDEGELRRAQGLPDVLTLLQNTEQSQDDFSRSPLAKRVKKNG